MIVDFCKLLLQKPFIEIEETNILCYIPNEYAKKHL